MKRLPGPRNWQGSGFTRGQIDDVRIERNYLHHNAAEGSGYGVVVGGPSYATIQGNVFDYNRHDITSSGVSFSGYRARFNYLLQGGFTYGGNGYWGSHLDIHGTRITLRALDERGPVVRRLVAEAAWRAIRRSPGVRSFFGRAHRADPQRQEIAPVATAHYLVRVMWAMLRHGTTWQEKPVRAA